MKNYQFIKKEFIKDINTEAIVYQHKKTKAKICLLENDDNNKVFTIAFRTPAIDNTGLTHILEHSVLCGSKKYPVKEPFVELLKGSLQTFLNAMTYPDKTVYPVASCNDTDFNNLMGIYMDAVMNPNIYDIKEIFLQEGWNYKLENINDSLTINGVVYNEMKGATSSVDDVMFRNILSSLNPDNAYQFNSGGDPLFIPELSYEKFLDFHKKYYHPSNSYIIIYGNCNMEEKLEFIDKEYLSKYEYLEFDTKVIEQEKFNNINKVEVEYPINKDDSIDNKTNISINYQIGKFNDIKLNLSFDILTAVLLHSDSAYLKKALVKANIAQDVSGMFMDGLHNSLFSIIIKNTNKENNDKFKTIVNDTLTELVNNGIDKEMLHSTLNYYEFKRRENNNGSTPVGISYSLGLLSTWLYDDNDITSSLSYSEIYSEIKQLIETNYFEQLIEKYLLNNKHSSNVICLPSHTLADERNNKLVSKLNKYKESLSEEELNNLLLNTKKLNDYQNSEVTEEALATIPKLARNEIPVNVEPLKNDILVVDGTTMHHQNYFTSNINYMQFRFSFRNISNELLPYVKLLTTILGRVDTKNNSLDKLENIEKLFTGGIGITPSVVTKLDNTFLADIVFSTSALTKNLDEALNLIVEIRDDSIIEEGRLLEILMEQKNRLQMAIARSGHVFSAKRALSYVTEAANFDEQISGISYLDFLNKLIINFNDCKNSILSNFDLIIKTYFTKENLVVSYGGSDLDIFKTKLSIFTNNLEDKFNCIEEFKFVPNALNEGIKVPGDVQYVSRGNNFVKLGFEYSGVLEVLKTILSTDYLWQEVRVKGGAYGCMVMSDITGGFAFTSYRDPNLIKTNNTYLGVVDYINNLNLSSDDILKSVIGTIGSIDAPSHISGTIAKALGNALRGVSNEFITKQREDIINVSLEQLKSLSNLIDCVLKENTYCVIGNENVIDENKKFFNKIRVL